MNKVKNPDRESIHTVWKFPIKQMGKQTLWIPQGGKPLTAEITGEEGYLWVLVNPKATLTRKTIRIYGTGHAIANLCRQRYICTVRSGVSVWHIFEEIHETE